MQFHAVVNRALPELVPWCSQHELSALPAEVHAQHKNLSLGKPKGAHIFLWKPFLYHLIDSSKAIVLDLDVVLLSGVRLQWLWSEFMNFEPHEVLGLVREQGPTYASYGSGVGFNGGVQLHHLHRMRRLGQSCHLGHLHPRSRWGPWLRYHHR